MSLFDRGEFEAFVLSLPATEIVRQWGDASVGKVGGKIFCILSDPDQAPRISFKCSDMAFELLPELDGIGPAPYLARAKWVALGADSALSADELSAYLGEAHRIIAAKLPRRLREMSCCRFRGHRDKVFLELERWNAKKAVQSRVQARGSEVGQGAGRIGRPGGPGP